VAWRMWLDNPAVGVGLYGFREHSASYVMDLGPLSFANFLVEQPKFAHNTYLELLAETGFIGFVLYTAVVVACLRCCWQAARRFEAMGDEVMGALARGLIVSILAMLTAATFISSPTDRRTWVLLALGPALLATAKQEGAGSSPRLRTRRRGDPGRAASTGDEVASADLNRRGGP